MFEPVKVALGQHLGEFYRAIVPTTQPLREFVTRGLEQSMAWAPSRMIDAAEEMLSSWQRNDNAQGPTRPAKIPAVIVAVGQDYTPTGRDVTTSVSDPISVIIPGDPKERHFKLRTIAGDIRAQLAIFAADEPTAKSIASQFILFLESPANRNFTATYRYAGVDMPWPMQIATADTMAVPVPQEAKNLTILAVDITLRAQVPLFQAPGPEEPNDGKGTGPDDPSGYPLVTHVTYAELPPL